MPEGTQNGAQFKLRHQGVAIVNSGSRVDLYVHISVKMPTRLTREQRKLLEQLRETLPVDNQPSEKGIFDKVKDYFIEVRQASRPVLPHAPLQPGQHLPLANRLDRDDFQN